MNPFNSSGSIKVNYISPNIFNDNILVPLASCYDTYINSPSNHQSLVYDSTNETWNNETVSHLNLSNIGTNKQTHIHRLIRLSVQKMQQVDYVR